MGVVGESVDSGKVEATKVDGNSTVDVTTSVERMVMVL